MQSPVLERVAAGDSSAMKEVVDQYGGLVWSIARRYLRDEGMAEDVVQEVFTEVWRKAPRFDPARSSESTFIGLIARRRSIDVLRRQSRQPVFEPIDAMSVEIGDAGPDGLSAPGDPDAALKALRELPDETRSLFDLHFRLGLTHGEIAEKTGLPLGTVKTRLRRGLVALRDRMLLQNPIATPAS